MGIKFCPNCGHNFSMSKICPKCYSEPIETDCTSEKWGSLNEEERMALKKEWTEKWGSEKQPKEYEINETGLVGSLVRSFKRILNTIAWIWLIIGGVIGSVVGVEVGATLAGYQYSSNILIPVVIFGFFGFAIGMLITYLFEVLIIPPLAILFSIHSELQNIKKIIKK